MPYGIEVFSYVANTVGVNALILNVGFLICMCQLPKIDSSYNTFIINLSVCDIFGSFFFIVTQNWPQGQFAQITAQTEGHYIWTHGSPYVFRSIPWMFFTAYMFTLNCLSGSQYLASCRTTYVSSNAWKQMCENGSADHLAFGVLADCHTGHWFWLVYLQCL